MSARMIFSAALTCATWSNMGLAPAAAQGEPMIWTAIVRTGGVALVYGVKDSPEEVLFLLNCNNARKFVDLNVFEEIKGAKVGRPLKIELSAARAKATIAGTTATNELMGIVYGHAKGFRLAPLVKVLSATGPVTVKTMSATVTLPDTGRAKQTRSFARACKLK